MAEKINTKPFILHSDFKPSGDQPQAIEKLVENLEDGLAHQTLLGVTGSGKTFTIANVIATLNRPAMLLAPNKTLAAQLYAEMKAFFPENAVEYFVSYYDYYQPEAYIPSSDLYIEKDMAINEEIDRLRLAATSALLSGRKDVIVVSSVSCIYGMGNPAAFYENVIDLKVGSSIGVTQLLQKLIASLYTRNDVAPKSGNFRVNGDTVDIYLAYTEEIIRVTFWGDDVDTIEEIDALSGYRSATFEEYKVYPANLFLTSKETQELAIRSIQDDLVEQVQKFEEEGKMLEAKRLSERVSYDIEMIRELGHCSGIENYSRYFDGRSPGTRPYCLLDFFPEDFLIVIDESHVTVPQIRAMWGGDRHRKVNLVNYGFRLPAALDNRPLTFDEFHQMAKQVIYISATPDDYELQESEGVIVEQIIRPTGLLDPPIEVRPNDYPIDDFMEEIRQCIEREERVLVTTLTKKMSEELTDYLLKNGIKTAYIHSDIDTLERVRIMEDLRKGTYDVLVGVNLLREGLDLPEVALVAILDADKEGFLRSTRSMTQTAGRAARNVNGRVIMYANRITTSMQQTIDETNRRRAKQIAYNEQHHLKPRQIKKKIKTNQLTELSEARQSEKSTTTYDLRQTSTLKAAEDQAVYGKKETYEERHARLEKQMKTAAEHLDFVLAAQLRDELLAIEKEHKNGH